MALGCGPGPISTWDDAPALFLGEGTRDPVRPGPVDTHGGLHSKVSCGSPGGLTTSAKVPELFLLGARVTR